MGDDSSREAEEYLFKVVIIGARAVGKSNLLPPPPTRSIGFEFQTDITWTICTCYIYV
jgi:hypothetical protein